MHMNASPESQPKKHVSPKDVFLYLLTVAMLYVSVWRFIDLWFGYINKLYPDAVQQYFGFDDIRISMATLIIVVPIFLGLSWYLRKDAIAHPEKRDLRIRKWLFSLTLFFAAVMIIVDLVFLVNNFLNGELSLRFFLKVLVVFIVASAVFGYYFWDLKRETLPTSKPSKLVVTVAGLVVLGSIVAGFFIVGSPFEQRMRRFDEQRVSDLQQIQWQVTNYWQFKQKMPDSLADLNDPLRGFRVPVDPKTGQAYEYNNESRDDTLAFELCATFGLPSSDESIHGKYAVPYGPQGEAPSDWAHDVGKVCFDRTIDPAFYPLF